MTRVVITSDLHLGITKRDQIESLVAEIAAAKPDLTVIAGDIGEGEANIRACLALFQGLPGEVAALGGNHDVWALSEPWKLGGPDSQEMWERVLPEAVRDAGMRWLEEETWRSSGLAVAGSIAWYDYTGAAEDIPPQTEAFWVELKHKTLPNGRFINPDAKYINWPWTDVEFAMARADTLVERVAALEADPGVEAILLVTHMPIFREQLIIKPEAPNWGYTNAFFANLTLGQRIGELGKLRAVISGHTHVPRDSQHIVGNRSISVQVVESDFRNPGAIIFDYP